MAPVNKYYKVSKEIIRSASESPMTTFMGAGGAAEGLSSTERKPYERRPAYLLRASRNAIMGGAQGAIAGKTLELAVKHLKTVAKEADKPSIILPNNHSRVKAAALRDFVKTIPNHSRISIGMSATGLGISASNFRTNKSRTSDQSKQGHISEESLKALKGIHQELQKARTQGEQGTQAEMSLPPAHMLVQDQD